MFLPELCLEGGGHVELFLCSSRIASLKLGASSCGQPCDGKITAGMVSSKAFAAVQKYAGGSDQSEDRLYTWLLTLWAPFLSSGEKVCCGIHPVLAI